ncbi:MAG: response regulator transcription factor [Elusimicrobia bacterium]|nr:response regulator transcription factor [Elusimicrobiota bacterium]
MHKTILLVIDDDVHWLAAAVKYFTVSGFEVRTAATCAAGIELASAARPDCLLLDFHLTDGDGGAVCSRLRSDPALGKTPIIMVSGDLNRELDSYNEYKADGFILKGTQFAKVLAVIESVLRRVRWERGIFETADLRLEKETCRVFKCSRLAATLSPEQFRLFSMLIEKSPEFVSEDFIARYVIGTVSDGRTDAVRALLHRLRQKLGVQLGRRIKSKRNLGWIYVQPRLKPSPAA